MAAEIVSEAELTAIADAVRAKTGTTAKIKFKDMAEKLTGNFGTYLAGEITTVSESDLAYPDGTIPDYAFWGQTKLKDVVIPSTITRIGNCAFEGSWDNDNNEYTAYDNKITITVKSDEVVLGSACFNNPAITSITFTGGSKLSFDWDWDGYQFQDCAIKEIAFPFKTIDFSQAWYLFYGCSNLTSIDLSGADEFIYSEDNTGTRLLGSDELSCLEVIWVKDEAAKELLTTILFDGEENDYIQIKEA